MASLGTTRPEWLPCILGEPGGKVQFPLLLSEASSHCPQPFRCPGPGSRPQQEDRAPRQVQRPEAETLRLAPS